MSPGGQPSWTEPDVLSSSRPAEIGPPPTTEYSGCQEMTTPAQTLTSGDADSRNESYSASKEHANICPGSPRLFPTPATAVGEVNMRTDMQKYHRQHDEGEVGRLGPPASAEPLQLRYSNRHALANDHGASYPEASYETSNAFIRPEMSDCPAEFQQIQPFSSYAGVDPQILELNRPDTRTFTSPRGCAEEVLDAASSENPHTIWNECYQRQGGPTRARSSLMTSELEKYRPGIAADEFDPNTDCNNPDPEYPWMYRRIVGRKIDSSGRKMVKVEWEDTWELECDLEDLTSALQRYEREQLRRQGKQGKQGRRAGVRKRKGRP
ncbi:Hypothetical protein PENO1_111450 [Penicillium occitanis (nom. inval.)]|nr:Hypothetical protein PENO1_111450 [Penicillium occitanis (nom. inval.)]PCG88271.1 hypothetical protein PENOC_111740 [Penicillium occitanis (nom. inval.)]